MSIVQVRHALLPALVHNAIVSGADDLRFVQMSAEQAAKLLSAGRFSYSGEFGTDMRLAERIATHHSSAAIELVAISNVREKVV